jgi:hypothetical protein
MTNTEKKISPMEFLFLIAKATFVTLVAMASPWLVIPAYILVEGLTKRQPSFDSLTMNNEEKGSDESIALVETATEPEIVEPQVDSNEGSETEPTKKARKPRAKKLVEVAKQEKSPKPKGRRSTKN